MKKEVTINKEAFMELSADVLADLVRDGATVARNEDDAELIAKVVMTCTQVLATMAYELFDKEVNV